MMIYCVAERGSCNLFNNTRTHIQTNTRMLRKHKNVHAHKHKHAQKHMGKNMHTTHGHKDIDTNTRKTTNT